MVVMKMNNPLSALAAHFALFFVFNLEYPAAAAVTMESIQRSVLLLVLQQAISETRSDECAQYNCLGIFEQVWKKMDKSIT